MEKIYFYGRHLPHFTFSNFSRHSFELDGYTWKTSEHYFQANKFLNQKDYDDVRLSATPSDAAKIGRDRNRPLRPDWEDIKEKVMRAALYAKFTQNNDALNELLNTGNAIIIEASPKDYYWGAGADGSGKNRLGCLLVELREYLRKEIQ